MCVHIDSAEIFWKDHQAAFFFLAKTNSHIDQLQFYYMASWDVEDANPTLLNLILKNLEGSHIFAQFLFYLLLLCLFLHLSLS